MRMHRLFQSLLLCFSFVFVTKLRHDHEEMKHNSPQILTCVSLTIRVVSWLLVQGSPFTVLALIVGTLVFVVLILGLLCEDGLWTLLTVLESCCAFVSSADREHCRRFFLRWCGRLLRQAGGFRRSGTKACAFL